MWKVTLFLIVVLNFSFCNQAVQENKLKVEGERSFSQLKFQKVFEISLTYCRWCVPLPERIICQQVVSVSEREYRLLVYDYSGRLVKERIAKRGQGPNDIFGIYSDSIRVALDGKRVTFIDGNGYLKSLDIDNLGINTLVKLSNVINGYGSRYVFGRHSSTDFEMNGETTITSFESTGFYDDLKYYFVEYEGIFEDFRVIAALKKSVPFRRGGNKLRENSEFLMDYYDQLRLARIFSVDWKRKMIFSIPYIEKPEIERISFDGKMDGLYYIDIDAEKFEIEREEFDSYCEWFLSNEQQMFKSLFKYTCYIPPHAPALQGIKVIEDWLLVITGKRDWEKDENEVLVFSLPSLHYEGSFYIPFPHAPTLKTAWYGDFYITRNLREVNDDYINCYTIYRIERR